MKSLDKIPNSINFHLRSLFQTKAMEGLAKIEDWVPLQVKVFTRWVNSQLKDKPEFKVSDITKDLADGVSLVELAEYLTASNPPRSWAQNPKYDVEKVQNCDLAIDMFTKDGVKLVGISGKDVHDDNEKLILGLIWSLILHYSINQSVEQINADSKENVTNTNAPKNNKDALMQWAINRTSHYPNIHNFSPFDLSLCALLDSYVPEKINYYCLNPQDSTHNSKLATDTMNELGIPVFVYPEDISAHGNQVDSKTLLTQLSSAKVVLDAKEVQDRKAQAEHEEAERTRRSRKKRT